jgi:hypothetical protein
MVEECKLLGGMEERKVGAWARGRSYKFAADSDGWRGRSGRLKGEVDKTATPTRDSSEPHLIAVHTQCPLKIHTKKWNKQEPGQDNSAHANAWPCRCHAS